MAEITTSLRIRTGNLKFVAVIVLERRVDVPAAALSQRKFTAEVWGWLSYSMVRVQPPRQQN